MASFSDRWFFAATALDVQAAGIATAAGITARQQVRLSRLLYFLAHSNTLYAPHLRDFLDGSITLQTLPIFHRSELMQRFDQWVTDPKITLQDLQTFTNNPGNIGQPYLQRYTVWKSSGSAGQPCIFVQDPFAMAVYDALEAFRPSAFAPLLRCMDPLLLNERIAFVGATDGHFASIVSLRRLATVNPWTAQVTCCMSILQPTEALVAQLNDYAPSILATYPSVASMLAEQTAKGALRIAPRNVWCGGETLSDAERRLMKHVWHCNVENHYGSSEFFSMAAECSHGHLHLNSDWVILEGVDEHFKPVPKGSASATTLLTNLANTVQPLLRYDIGDQISFMDHPCACGSPLPAIDVTGRRDAPLRLLTENGDTVVLLPMALTTVLEEQGQLFDFQLRQRDAQALELAIPHRGAQAEEALRRASDALQKFLRIQGLRGVRITRRSGVEMPRGQSGKSARVLSG